MKPKHPIVEKVKLRAVLVDDNENALSSLEMMVRKYCPQVTIVGTSQEVNQAVALIEDTKPNILFLDIELNNDTGFGLLEKVSYEGFSIIFCTAHKDFAIQAIKSGAVDYLMKPIECEDLRAAIQRVIQNLEESEVNLLNEKVRIAPPLEHIREMMVPDQGDYAALPMDQVIYVVAQGSYSVIHTNDGRELLSSKNLKYFETLLESEGFHRVHRKYLVAIRSIEKVERNGRAMFLILHTGESIPVSFRERKNLMDRMN